MRVLAVVLAAVLVLPALPLQAQVRLPALGESASDDLGVNAERRIGDSIMREARRDPEFLDDPVLQDYLDGLFAPLVAAARQVGQIDPDTDRAFAWEAFLVRDRSVNAFALPGGFVGVHLGLVAITSTRDQLASVLAHELSHVTQRHIARSIAPQARASVLAIATMLLGVIAASKSRNADVFNAAVMGGQGAAIQTQLNFSRDMEREADRIGFGLMDSAGFAPSGMPAMFEKLDLATRLNDTGGFPYLRSHPLTTDRIAEARSRSLFAQSAAAAPTLQHMLMQMRSRALMAEGTQALQRLAGASTAPLRNERLATLYGGALAASLLRDHASAKAQLAQALNEIGPAGAADALRSVALLQVEVLSAAGEHGAALAVLDRLEADAAAVQPPSGGTAAAAVSAGRPERLLRAQTVLAQTALLQRTAASLPANAQAALRDTAERLQTALADHPDDAASWELLARATDGLGLKLRSLRAAAEARAALGDSVGAIDRLRAAQAASKTAQGQDFIEGSVIDARLRQLQAQRRQLVLDARNEGRGGGAGPGDNPQR